MSNFFKSKENKQHYDVVQDPYKNVREPLIDWVRGQIGKSAPQYQGEMVAPMSDEEQQSLNWLKNYVNGGESSMTTAAKGEISKTLEGDAYDPTKSGYYQAVKAEAAKNLEDTQRNIASNAAGGGDYWTGARLGEQQKAATDSANKLNAVLYGLAEKERQNKLDAASKAAALGQMEEQEPLQKAEALQSVGSLPRTLQQAYDEAVYNEWLRATQDYPLQIASLASGLAREPYYAQTTKTPSQFGQMMSNPQTWATLAMLLL